VIDRLIATDLRELWPNEATNFTPWLADNIDLLGDALGMTLEEPETEVSVGGFSVDLVAVNDQSEKVVVENLLELSDHGHLGQLITYAAGLDAAYAVLVAKSFRDEHRSALGYLNEISRDEVGFFGVEVAAWRIADSPPAPQLNVVVEPDNWRRGARAAASGRKTIYTQFWAGFLPKLHDAGARWRGTKTPSRSNWIQFKSLKPYVKYNARITTSSLLVVAYIDTGEHASTSGLFDWLHNQSHEIEADLGTEVVWNRFDQGRASVIKIYYPEEISIDDSDSWPTLWEWLVPTMVRLAQVIDPLLNRYE